MKLAGFSHRICLARELARGSARRTASKLAGYTNCVLALSFSLVLFSGTVALAADTPRRENYADRYGPLVEHNIFVKERPVKSKPSTQPTTAAAPRTTEESLVLRGIALE